MADIVGHILILVMAMTLSTPSCFAGSPVVNFMDEMDGGVPPPTMNFNCKQGEIPRAQFDLVAGQKHSFEVTRDGVYDCDVVWGKFFCSVEGFNPARDKGQNSVNWKADNHGLSLSYDLKNWEWVAPWKTD
nr:DNA topoisomerase [Ipomoea batatas]